MLIIEKDRKKVQTKHQIKKLIEKTSKDTTKKNLKIVKTAEKKINKKYNDIAGKVGNLILNKGTDIGGLNKLTDNLTTTMKELSTNMTSTVSKTIDEVISNTLDGKYMQINLLKDILPKNIIQTDAIKQAFGKPYDEATKAMIKTQDGIELSEKIWDTHKTMMRDMRQYLANSMMEGKTASEIYTKVKSFLKQPKVDMRKKEWKDFFKKNPPGRGVYRSAYKNVLRILRTETNRAYKLAEVEYAKGKTWMKGMRFVLSDAHPEYDVCDELATQDLYGLGEGVYPPENYPTQGHPQCLCHTETVINDDYLNLPENIDTEAIL